MAVYAMHFRMPGTTGLSSVETSVWTEVLECGTLCGQCVLPVIEQIKASGATVIACHRQVPQRTRNCDSSRRRLDAGASHRGAAPCILTEWTTRPARAVPGGVVSQIR